MSGFVADDARVVVTAPCFQATTREGAWLGPERAGAGEVARDDDTRLLEACERTGRALAAAGYRGPYGIDAFRCRTEPGAPVVLNPLSEINARLTMDWAVAFEGRAASVRMR